MNVQSYFYNEIWHVLTLLVSLPNTWSCSKPSLWPGSALCNVLCRRFGWLRCFMLQSFCWEAASRRSECVCFKEAISFLTCHDSELLLELNSLPSPLSVPDSVQHKWEFATEKIKAINWANPLAVCTILLTILMDDVNMPNHIILQAITFVYYRKSKASIQKSTAWEASLVLAGKFNSSVHCQQLFHIRRGDGGESF